MPHPAGRPRCYRCAGWCYRAEGGWRCLPCGRDQAGQPRTPTDEEQRQDRFGARQGGRRL